MVEGQLLTPHACDQTPELRLGWRLKSDNHLKTDELFRHLDQSTKVEKTQTRPDWNRRQGVAERWTSSMPNWLAWIRRS